MQARAPSRSPTKSNVAQCHVERLSHSARSLGCHLKRTCDVQSSSVNAHGKAAQRSPHLEVVVVHELVEEKVEDEPGLEVGDAKDALRKLSVHKHSATTGHGVCAPWISVAQQGREVDALVRMTGWTALRSFVTLRGWPRSPSYSLPPLRSTSSMKTWPACTAESVSR